MKFLKTIRFDGSDEFVFEKAAQTGSWAIPGGFMFAHLAADELTGKPRQAFRNGFLSIEDSGWSTFVSVGELSEEKFNRLHELLAAFLTDKFNAPSAAAASEAARAELAFAAEICADVPINTIFSLQREHDEAGDIKEVFRIVETPKAPVHTKIWELVEE